MRDKDRPEWEKRLMGVIAGSAGALTKEHPAATDAVQAVELLKAESERFPWAVIALVGRDGRIVTSRVPKAEAVARVNQMNGAIGLAGLIFLRDKITTFARPFIPGAEVAQRLRDVIEKNKQDAVAIIRDNKDDIEEASSPVSAKVYTDGKQATIFWSWEPPLPPQPGWELAGTLYVVPASSGKAWQAKARFSEKWQSLMDEALSHFNQKLKPILPLLNKLGLSLTNLKPGLEKDLEKALQKE